MSERPSDTGKYGLVAVDTAIAIRDFLTAIGAGTASPFLFLCPACKEAVRPQAGDTPIFKHVKANPTCPRRAGE